MSNHKKVISFPVPTHWRFFDYVEGDWSPIANWYDNELSEEGKYSFDALLKNTHKIQNHLYWTGFKFLKGEPKKERIWQLDFIADKRQYRLLGVFGEARMQAVLILGCYHKGDVYTPHKALETARKRAKALREKKAGIRERQIKSDI